MECKKCLNNNSVRNIKFDNNDICNFCTNYEKIEKKINDYEYLEKLFIERIEKIKGKHKYDVALGISGGKDSIYVLNELTKKYNLKVKTFTMNNGFLSKEAIKNIDKIVEDFQVEHEYINFDKELLQRIYHYSMSHFLVPCIACSYIGYAAMINYASKIDAGMCIHGRSPEQMLRYYNKDVFSSFIDAGLKSINEVDINDEYMKLLDSVKDKVDEGIFNDIRNLAFDGLEQNDFREFVPYFLYHNYDEEEIVKYLKENTNWNPPEDYNHYDCQIHEAAKYIYQCAEGRPHRLPEISVLIRMGKITKQQGKELLEKEIIKNKPKEELKMLFKYANVNETLLFTKAKIYNKVIKK